MRWKRQPSRNIDTPSSELKTIREWEQEYQILILDVDGFDVNDSQLYNRLFSRREFEQAVAECTILRKKPELSKKRVETQEAPKSSRPTSQKQSGEASPEENEPRRRKNVKVNRATVWLLIAFTLPTLATLLIYWTYQKINRLFKVPWYVPIALVATDGVIGLIQPISPFISGPGYFWYLILNSLTQIFRISITFVQGNILHHPLGLTTGDPAMFLSNTSLAGNAVPLYFTFGSALASSVYLATILTFTADIGRRIFVSIPSKRKT